MAQTAGRWVRWFLSQAWWLGRGIVLRADAGIAVALIAVIWTVSLFVPAVTARQLVGAGGVAVLAAALLFLASGFYLVCSYLLAAAGYENLRSGERPVLSGWLAGPIPAWIERYPFTAIALFALLTLIERLAVPWAYQSTGDSIS